MTNNYFKPNASYSLRVGLLLLTLCLFSGFNTPVQAQDTTPETTSTISAETDRAEILDLEDEAKVTKRKAASNALADLDFAAMTKKEWKRLCKEQIKDLQSADDATWDQALANITFLSTFYRDKVDFTSITPWLIHTYIYARWQQARLAALAAIHAIGDEETMIKLAHHVQNERNPKVRQLTMAVLADFFNSGKRPIYIVGNTAR